MPTFGESPPPWMMPVNWMSGIDFDAGSKGVQIGIQAALEQQRINLAKQAQASDAISQGLRNQLMQEQLANITGAKVEVADWMKQAGPGAWGKLNTPITATNPQAIATIRQIQASAADTADVQNQVELHTEFRKQVYSLEDPVLQQKIREMPFNKDGTVSSAQLQALRDALILQKEYEAINSARLRKIAEESRIGGMRPSLTYDEKAKLRGLKVEPPLASADGMTAWQKARDERQKRIDSMTLSPSEKLIMDSKSKQLASVEEQIAKLEQEGFSESDVTSSFVGMGGGKPTENAKTLKKLNERRESLLNEIKNFTPSAAKGSGVRRYNPVTDSFE